VQKAVQYAIDNRAVTYFVVFILFFGGIASFFSLGQLEDPVFSIKTAVIQTNYPGASPEEVELEVTDILEQAVQEMPQLKNIYSTSTAGVSTIKVDIKDQYWSPELPQIWDELRKKIEDAAKKLPPGVETPSVFDDFGFVYGFVLALTGDGFSPRELEFYADTLKKEISLVKGVTRVELWGVQPQVIYVDVREQTLNELGISAATILDTLKQQNMVVDAGGAEVNRERLRIAPTGYFKSPVEIGELHIRPSTTDVMSQLVSPTGYLMGPQQIGVERFRELTGRQAEGGSADIISLKDIATIRRGYQDPPVTLMRYNGEQAVGIAIAGSDAENIVTVGDRIDRRIDQLQQSLPIGIALQKIAWQSSLVEESVNSFIRNLIAAVAIVLIVLIIPSGFRMGCIIGFDLIVTILGTFIFMALYEIPLQRMSLGALIIALGMMVDNAIVVSDTIAVKIRQGVERKTAAIASTAASAYPLFAATVVAILAFYPIYASTAGAGEYCQTLFTVVAASLLISWLVAMFITPVQCIDFLAVAKPKKKSHSSQEFDTSFYNRFRNILEKLMHFRLMTLCFMVGLLALSLFGFNYVSRMFFPDSSRPQMMVDYWAPEGTRIQDVAKNIGKLEKAFLNSSFVSSTSSFIGAGPPRFYLPVDPEGVSANFGQIIVNFPTHTNIDPFIDRFQPFAKEAFPGAMIRFRKYAVGPGNTWKFEARFSGPANADLGALRDFGEKVQEIAGSSRYGTDWRLDMQNKTMKIVPLYDQKNARLSSISRKDVARTTRRGFDGLNVGLYREMDKLLPIVVRHSGEERKEFVDRMETLQVQPAWTTRTVPLSQAISSIDLEWENPIIARWNRRRTVTVQGDAKRGETFPTLQKDVMKKMENIILPPGYELYWDGEASSTTEAQRSLIPGVLPAAILIVFSIVTVFNAYRPLLIILCTIPFALIGITLGLLALQTPFGFMALLGAMSLAGMMNKNIVVLLDAAEENLKSGMDRYKAILEASVTRVRPVLLAAGTTVLGVIPLVFDNFWTAMAVTIMAGLTFGSVLTLIVVPVFYAILYRVKAP